MLTISDLWNFISSPDFHKPEILYIILNIAQLFPILFVLNTYNHTNKYYISLIKFFIKVIIYYSSLPTFVNGILEKNRHQPAGFPDPAG